MNNFEQRRDRFDLFHAMESPAVNLSFTMELPDFRPWCKAQALPPFHVLLYAISNAILKIENFRYRVFEGEVICIDRLIPSYTVVNKNKDLNFAQFEWSDDLQEFVARSIAARDHAEAMTELNDTYHAMSPREWKDQVFVTCMPWLDLTAIEHPMASRRSGEGRSRGRPRLRSAADSVRPASRPRRCRRAWRDRARNAPGRRRWT